MQNVHFHKSSFARKPFYSLDTSLDLFNQALPNSSMQVQPRLEAALRRQIHLSKWCTLRTGCKVVSQLSDEPPAIEYVDETGALHQIEGQWLIGADGKTGIVRKYFLEPIAGIRQEEGVYKYSGTWIAANLRITLPTRQTHPQFPLWDAGYSPDAVHDLFWPKGWHFCTPPGKATATGRFGTDGEGLWRHEFSQDNWDDSMNAVELLWEHITPMITRERDNDGRKLPQFVEFPRDCIEVIRCRPFKFVHKVVNKWYDKRTILIGDAAHVFPPFAGQGMGSGVRDAHQLAWRLALLFKVSRPSQSLTNRILDEWALERRKSVDDAALFTLLNGRLCNEEPSIWREAVLRVLALLALIPFFRILSDATVRKEREGMTTTIGGFFLKQFNGGARLAQIFVQSFEQGPVLSDCLFKPKQGVLTLLVISTSDHAKLQENAQAAIEAIKIDPSVLAKDSVILFSPHSIHETKGQMEVFWPASYSDLDSTRQPGYVEGSFVNRLGRSTKFAIVRPDFYVFACARNLDELIKSLTFLKGRLAD